MSKVTLTHRSESATERATREVDWVAPSLRGARRAIRQTGPDGRAPGAAPYSCMCRPPGTAQMGRAGVSPFGPIRRAVSYRAVRLHAAVSARPPYPADQEQQSVEGHPDPPFRVRDGTGRPARRIGSPRVCERPEGRYVRLVQMGGRRGRHHTPVCAVPRQPPRWAGLACRPSAQSVELSRIAQSAYTRRSRRDRPTCRNPGELAGHVERAHSMPRCYANPRVDPRRVPA